MPDPRDTAPDDSDRIDALNTRLQSCAAEARDAAQELYDVGGFCMDSRGRMYITDVFASRIIRFDDMNGKNWTTFGKRGSGKGEFKSPGDVWVDNAGHIFILDDGNGRIVRMDDMHGSSWRVWPRVDRGQFGFNAITGN
ncbi:MAG: 6-bladed beta-propeller [Chloroflexi bacterium]|nr:6-bladed beta-propeller [Chloroflexota bacterium]